MLEKMVELKIAIRSFFDVRWTGSIPWTHYLDSFKANDFGLALRIEEDLVRQNRGIAIMVVLATLVLAILIIICTAAILKSQRKTRKMLEEIQKRQKAQPEQGGDKTAEEL